MKEAFVYQKKGIEIKRKPLTYDHSRTGFVINNDGCIESGNVHGVCYELFRNGKFVSAYNLAIEVHKPIPFEEFDKEAIAALLKDAYLREKDKSNG